MSDCTNPDCAAPEAIAATLATEPLDATDVATSPGTPHAPPSSQSFEPGGLDKALAISPPIGKYVPTVPPVAMRKYVTSWPSAGNAAKPSAPARRERRPSIG